MKIFLVAVCLGLALLASSSFAVAQEPPPDLAGYIDAYAAEKNLQGVIRVQAGSEVLYHRAFGQADRAFAVPTTTDTRFRIASITKVFTAVVMLQLQEEGRIDLDDPVGRHLPDLPGEAGGRVTLRQLLNHTSGIAQLDTVASYQEGFANGIPHYQRPMTLAALVAHCCTGALVAAPGTAFNYNNADYILLAAIIEQATGRNWEAEVQDRILKPLALADTGVAHWDAIIPLLTPTYTFRDDTQTLITDMPVYYENWSASGAMYSTAADLAAFADALYGGRLLQRPRWSSFWRRGWTTTGWVCGAMVFSGPAGPGASPSGRAASWGRKACFIGCARRSDHRASVQYDDRRSGRLRSTDRRTLDRPDQRRELITVNE